MLKAFRLNAYEVWAGETLEQAIEACIAETGCRRDEAFDECWFSEFSDGTCVRVEDGEPGEFVTVGELLSSMDKPGLVCGYES
jgi:hypothetical protein